MRNLLLFSFGLITVLFTSCELRDKKSLESETVSEIEDRAHRIFRNTKNPSAYLDSVRLAHPDENYDFFLRVLSIAYDTSIVNDDKLDLLTKLAERASLENLDKYNKFKVRETISLILLEQGNRVSGINQMLMGIAEIEDEPIKYQSNLSDSYARLGKGGARKITFEEHIRFLTKAIYYQTDRVKLAPLYFDLGVHYLMAGKTELSKISFKKSLRLSKGHYGEYYPGYQLDAENHNWSNIYPTLAEIAALQQKPDSVLFYINAAQKQYDEQKIDSASFDTFKLHALTALVEIDNFQLAKEFINDLLFKFNEDCAHAYRLVVIYEELAKMNHKLGEREKEIEAQEKRYFFASQCGRVNRAWFISQQRAAMKDLIALFKSERNFEQASYYQEQLLSYMGNLEEASKEVENSSSFWTEFTLGMERNEKQYFESSLLQQRSRFYWLLLVTFLVSISAFYIYRLYNALGIKRLELVKHQDTLRKANAALQESNLLTFSQNHKLSAQKIELEGKLKEKLLLMGSILSKIEKIKDEVESMEKSSSVSTFKIQRELGGLIDAKFMKRLDFEFQNFNEEYIGELCRIHPSITSNNIKLCLLLKMNLSSKQIADLEGKSIESVKVARSRLRTKLQISDKDVSLSSYLNNLPTHVAPMPERTGFEI